MDLTPLFKASVMTVKLQRKVEIHKPDKNRILPKSNKSRTSAQRDDFAKQAKDVCQKITALREVLLSNRSAYMRIGQHLKNFNAMSDNERDVIDRETEKFILFYTQHLGQMRSDWLKSKRKQQQLEHMEAVLELLNNYLRCVQQIHLNQKKYRVQHELDTYRLLKLAPDKKKIPVRPGGVKISETQTNSISKNGLHTEVKTEEELLSNFSEEEWNNDWQIEDSPKLKRKEHKQKQNLKKENLNIATEIDSRNHNESGISETNSQTSQQVAVDEDLQKSQKEAANELTAEERQMFEQENMELYQELQGLIEEVALIEKNVVGIAELQDIFTEKVSLQQQHIERIANAVVGTTENVKDANEQLRQAIQRDAGMRAWTMFFLLVMSFTLLFLDWYYD